MLVDTRAAAAGNRALAGWSSPAHGARPVAAGGCLMAGRWKEAGKPACSGRAAAVAGQ